MCVRGETLRLRLGGTPELVRDSGFALMRRRWQSRMKRTKGKRNGSWLWRLYLGTQRATRSTRAPGLVITGTAASRVDGTTAAAGCDEIREHDDETRTQEKARPPLIVPTQKADENGGKRRRKRRRKRTTRGDTYQAGRMHATHRLRSSFGSDCQQVKLASCVALR